MISGVVIQTEMKNLFTGKSRLWIQATEEIISLLKKCTIALQDFQQIRFGFENGEKYYNRGKFMLLITSYF